MAGAAVALVQREVNPAGWLFSSSHVPSGWRFERTRSTASASRASGAAPAFRK